MNAILQKIKELRERTGIGINECVKALNANDNDLEKSMEWLKSRSLTFSKSSNSFNEENKVNKFGLVKVDYKNNMAIAFSLKCESDFVAASDLFIDLSSKLSSLV